MKQIIIFLCLVCLSLKSHSQSANVHNNNIKTNLISLFDGEISLGYERKISDKFSLQLMSSYKLFPTSVGNFSYSSGFSFAPELRYYFSSLCPKGFYGGLLMRYFNNNYKSSSYSYIDNSGASQSIINPKWKYTGVGAGLKLGYQLLISNGITFDFNGALVYSLNKVSFNKSNTSQLIPHDLNLKSQSLYFLLGAGIGYAF